MRRLISISLLCAALVVFLARGAHNDVIAPATEHAPPGAADIVATGTAVSGPATSVPTQPPSAATPDLPGKRVASATETVQADAVTVTSAHVHSSAPANEVELELAKLSLFDLKATVQRELLRLGCYDAKVDGRWGRKSEAAVAKFNERSGGNWGAATPSAKLAKALRGAPDGLCNAECRNAGGNACAIVAGKVGPAPKDRAATAGLPAGAAGDPSTYLPPWMQDGKLVSADPNGAIPAAAQAEPAAKKAAAKGKKQKTIAERTGNVERREVRPVSQQWTPRDWPGTMR
jgi:hypothetical protein